MNNVAEKMLDAFDVSARNWGYQSDQGVGTSVEAAREDYELSRAALVKYIEELQWYKTAVMVLQEQIAGRFPGEVAMCGALIDRYRRERPYRYLFRASTGITQAIHTIQTKHMPGSKVLTIKREAI